MRKDKVVLDRETYEKLLTLRDSNNNYYIDHYEQYQDLFYQEVNENKKLQRENGYLKALFDKESDTQVIKHNGKLYRVASTAHFKDDDEETLDVNFVCVREVN